MPRKKLDVDLILVHKTLSKEKNSKALVEIVRRMEYYGKIELNNYVKLSTIRAVFVGLLSTSSLKLKSSDIKIIAVKEFREYIRNI